MMTGCKKAPSVVGHWTVEVPAEAASNPMAASMSKMVTLEFPDEKTFKLTMIFPIEGTVAVSGTHVTLTPTKVMGMDPKSMGGSADSQTPMQADLSSDGNTLTIQPGANSKDGKPIVFKREATKS